MAGKIIADTLETGAGADISTSYVVNGSAKAWCNFDADAVVNESLNASSITDSSTGQFKLTISNAMDTTTYAQFVSSGDTKHSSGWSGTRSTTVSGILLFNNSHTYQDANDSNIALYGDLA